MVVRVDDGDFNVHWLGSGVLAKLGSVGEMVELYGDS